MARTKTGDGIEKRETKKKRNSVGNETRNPRRNDEHPRRKEVDRHNRNSGSISINDEDEKKLSELKIKRRTMKEETMKEKIKRKKAF